MKITGRAAEILEDIQYATVATVDADGQSWNSPLYVGLDADYNFYWASWQQNRHSKNIEANSKIFIVVYDSKAPIGKGEGVYIQATAAALHDETELLQVPDSFYIGFGKQPSTYTEYMGNMPMRIYKASPVKVWMNQDSEIDGMFVDKRIEIA